MKTIRLLVAFIVLVLLCEASIAQDQTPQPKTPRVTKRQINQQARIKQGAKSGELTTGETIKLEKEQGKIQQDKQKAKADGKVTPEERRKLRREQNKASRDVYHLKHNDRTKK